MTLVQRLQGRLQGLRFIALRADRGAPGGALRREGRDFGLQRGARSVELATLMTGGDQVRPGGTLAEIGFTRVQKRLEALDLEIEMAAADRQLLDLAAQRRAAEPEQRLIGFDQIAAGDQDRLHGAALLVMDGDGFADRLDGAGGDHHRANGRESQQPVAEHDEQQQRAEHHARATARLLQLEIERKRQGVGLAFGVDGLYAHQSLFHLYFNSADCLETRKIR